MDSVEVYVLCGSRSAAMAQTFLETCMPARSPIANEYPVPEFEQFPSHIFQSPEELVRYLELHTEESYSLYWESTCKVGPRQAMLFFTTDGGMIAGVFVAATETENALMKLSQLVGGRFGYISGSHCPPVNSNVFIEICRESTLANLFEGKLRDPSK